MSDSNKSYEMDERIPAELAAVAAAVDALASHERRSRAGLEERVFAATRGSLARAPRPREGQGDLRLAGTPADGAGVHRRRMRLLTPMRLAAAVAIGAGGLAAYMAMMSAGSAGAIQMAERASGTKHGEEFELVLAALDEPWFSESELDYLRVETDAVAESLSWDWALNSEGAM